MAKKILFISLGTLSLILGIIGIVVPGLPTTPFLLLTLALYVRSSERLYNWLMSVKLIRAYIEDYRENKGMSLHMKISSIGLMWGMIIISITWFIEQAWLDITLLLVGIIGSIVMGFVVPTGKK
ncbi:MAG: YbaN family protein [Bacteroidales bacterium]|nr:YbaN family protein [Bacteroidales bacterium]MCF8457868.1 YbaN family protein [Bacteroidales bacterium]